MGFTILLNFTMGQILILFIFLTYCSGVTSQATLTQPSSQSVSLGQTVKLSCTKSGSSSWGSFHWYQQKPGQAPRFVFYHTSNRGEGISDRFTGSFSGNTGYLTITGVQAGDEAVYYCCAYENSGSFWYVFGGGTNLIVTGQPTVSPTVNVFPPSPEELKGDKATVVCLIDGFHPRTVQVTWEADGTPISSGVETTQPTKLNDKYAASSYLSMKRSEWERYDAFTCKVTHEGQTFRKVVKRLECS